MKKIYKNELFCRRCLIHDHFFKGGGSWAPDSCPRCGGSDCITYEKLSPIKASSAKILFEKMWKEQYNTPG